MPGKDRPAWYRDIASELWRLSLDQGRDLRFEVRRRLATIAEEFEAKAETIERKMAAD